MFSKELENLIQATLEDGVLEDYEKAALVKRAQAEGVDLTELEIYINSILQKRKRELDNKKQAQRAETEQKKREDFGEKCPNCGQQRRPMALKCECGYEFTTKTVQSSVQQLIEKLDMIRAEEAPIRTSNESSLAYDSRLVTFRSNQRQRIIQSIELFPVPNTKEDIIEFLSICASKIKIKQKSNRKGFLGKLFSALSLEVKTAEEEAWENKFRQIIMKGRSLRGDADFSHQLDYYENLIYGNQ